MILAIPPMFNETLPSSSPHTEDQSTNGTRGAPCPPAAMSRVPEIGDHRYSQPFSQNRSVAQSEECSALVINGLPVASDQVDACSSGRPHFFTAFAYRSASSEVQS